MENYRKGGCRIDMGWSYEGIRCLKMENAFMSITLLLDAGSRIIEFIYKPLGYNFIWRHLLLKIRKPFCLASISTSNLIFDYWDGGWDEVFPTGLPCTYKGADFGMLGELIVSSWHCVIEEDAPDEVCAHLWTDTIRAPFRFHKWLTLRKDEKTLYIREIVKNRSKEYFEFLWLHHPLLKLLPRARVEIPGEEFLVEPRQCKLLEPGGPYRWPIARDKTGNDIDLRVLPPTNEAWELLYFTRLKDGYYKVFYPDLKIGFSLFFPKEVFKFLWMALLNGGEHNYPWYGSTYAIGLYPATGYPFILTEAIKEGVVSKLGPNESLEVELKASIITEE